MSEFDAFRDKKTFLDRSVVLSNTGLLICDPNKEVSLFNYK